MSLPPVRRGASLPAIKALRGSVHQLRSCKPAKKTYDLMQRKRKIKALRGSGHHALRLKREFRRLGVVLLSPQALVPSSTSTTPSGSNVSSAGSAWCFSPRKPLFLRRRAPRPQARTGLPPIRRGASLPANPCPFVDGHHAPRHEPVFHQSGVVLLSPQTLVPSSTGTTPQARTDLPRAGRT